MSPIRDRNMPIKFYNNLNFPLPHFIIISFILFGILYAFLGWSTFSKDDAHILQIAARYGWLEVYYKPEIYQQFSMAHYTPVELSIYKLLLTFTSLNPSSFLAFQLLCLGIISSLCGQLCFKITNDYWASIFVIILMFSSEATLTLASRFYTTHYLVGAIFSLSAFLLYYREEATKSITLILIAVTLFFSLQAKEVYFISAFLLFLLSMKKREFHVTCVILLTLTLHLALRWYVIGVSHEGRSGGSYVSEIFIYASEHI